jgi:hypothetical protein
MKICVTESRKAIIVKVTGSADRINNLKIVVELRRIITKFVAWIKHFIGLG